MIDRFTMGTNGKLRDQVIEAYRVLLMFGICFLHSCGAVCGHGTSWLAHLFMPCVPGFVFISGWFGMRFSLMRIVKLYLLALYAVVIMQILNVSFLGRVFDIQVMVKTLLSYWFLNAYVVLMCFAPALNYIVDNFELDRIRPILYCIFGWGFATTIPLVRTLIPHSAGIEASSGLMMIGVYIVARLTRLRFQQIKLAIKDNKHIQVKIVFICLVSIFMVAVGFSGYNSPFSIVVVILSFVCLKGMSIIQKISIYLSWIGPSCFSIYLLHSRGVFGLPLMSQFESFLLSLGINIFVVYILTAVATFCICLVLDLPRRIFLVAISKCRILK